jgi:hypothetical protein
MISTYVKPMWLGYSQMGGTASLRIDELGGRLLLLGGRANEIAALFAYASHEAGFRPLILDMDGYLASKVAGYFSSYRLADLLYDLYRLDESRPREHGELISSAYTAALDMSFEEEAILDAAMQHLAAQDNMASPPAVYDALSMIEGFRGFYVDKLKGRVGTLRSLDAADSASMAEVLSAPNGALVDLSGSGMPRAAELGATLFIVKLLTTLGSLPRRDMPNFIMINDAHRVFRALPKTMHGNRLLTAMLESPLTSVFASDQRQALTSLIMEACATKILSADAWNQLEREKRHWNGQNHYYNGTTYRLDKPMQPAPPPPVLPNSFVLVHGFYGSTHPFVARSFEARESPASKKAGEAAEAEATAIGEEAAASAAGAARSPPRSPSAPSATAPTDIAAAVGPVPPSVTTSGGGQHDDDGDEGNQSHDDKALDAGTELTRRILQEVSAYDSPSMQSMVSYLSGEFPKDAVEKAIDILEKEGYVKLSPRQQKSGRTMLSLTLTKQGTELLGRLA